MKQLLVLALLATTACSGAFSAGAPDALVGDAGSLGDSPTGDAHFVVPEAATGDAAGHDDAQLEAAAADVEAGGDDGAADGAADGAVVCTFYPPTYFTFNGCTTVSSNPNGFPLPLDFALQIVGGNECIAVMTPDACTCGNTYDCGCVMPALLAEQAAQKAGTETGLICAGALSDCTVDALGVIHVHCD